jgi:hypothetical protein
VLNLVGMGAEVGGLLLRSCGPNEHFFWGVWVERFAPVGGAIRPGGAERFAPPHLRRDRIPVFDRRETIREIQHYSAEHSGPGEFC